MAIDRRARMKKIPAQDGGGDFEYGDACEQDGVAVVFPMLIKNTVVVYHTFPIV